MTLTSCNSDVKKLEKSSIEIGRIQAGVNLPDLPPECDTQYTHAPITKGVDPLIILKQERRIVARANATIRLCAQNYRTVKNSFQKVPQGIAGNP